MPKWKEHHCSRTVVGKTLRGQSVRLAGRRVVDAENILSTEKARLHSLGFQTSEDIEPSLLVPNWDGSSTLFLYYW